MRKQKPVKHYINMRGNTMKNNRIINRLAGLQRNKFVKSAMADYKVINFIPYQPSSQCCGLCQVSPIDNPDVVFDFEVTLETDDGDLYWYPECYYMDMSKETKAYLAAMDNNEYIWDYLIDLVLDYCEAKGIITNRYPAREDVQEYL